MAKKQIIISQGDYGLLFDISIIDNNNKPVVISNEQISFYIVNNNDLKLKVTDVIVLDAINGIVEFKLQQEHTAVVGICMVYMEITNELYEINTVEAFSYYVVAKHGGVI